MPRRTELTIDENPYQYKGKKLRISKSYTSPEFGSQTILTDDVFTYVDFFFTSHKKAMKYRNSTSKAKYGSEKKYHYSFYWKQAMSFYKAASVLPIESRPLPSYYAMLNAVKAFLSFRLPYVEDFVEDFSRHGLFEDPSAVGNDLDTIMVGRQNKGVFVLFGKTLEPNFDTLWKSGKVNTVSLKKLLYNLAFIHRAYITTYNTPRGVKEPELFIPISTTLSPCYYKGNDSHLYLKFEIERSLFPPSSVSIPNVYMSTISSKLKVSGSGNFILQSTNGARRNSADSLSFEFRTLNSELRREFQYIRSSRRLWYLKRTGVGNNVLDFNSMLIIMAAMHRISEIVRYKPEQLAHIMDSKENWLLHEFISLAMDQFIDEIAAEITGQEIMSTGTK